MITSTKGEQASMKNHTTVERKSECELVITRAFEGPARIVFEAFTKPELLKRWWAPKSSGSTLASCQVDLRAGGKYRFEFDLGSGRTMAFFGKYVEVIPHTRLAWTNEESDGGAVTTLTFQQNNGQTLVVWHELYPSKKALEQSMSGMEGGMTETFGQLDELLGTLGTKAS